MIYRGAPVGSIDQFGGLDLRADPQEAGLRAISCLNVALDRDGRLRSRDGYDTVYTVAGSSVLNLHPATDNMVLAACTADSVRVVDVSAGTSAANVALGANYSSFASTGTGTYFTNGTAGQIRKFVAPATFSSPASLATYEGNYLAVQPLDDRLVIADANSTSKLWFSDVATPETIDTSNFLELTPGDGERITGMEVFGTELFVFKETKFFVFYGNSTDSTGGAIFNYRMVDTGIGCNATGGEKLTTSDASGVYFVGFDGVYRTTGGTPVCVSDPVAPVFAGANYAIPAPFSSLLTAPVNQWSHLGIARGRLYLAGFTVLGAAIQFVMDLHGGAWTVMNIPALSVLDGPTIQDVADTAGLSRAVVFGGYSGSVVTAGIHIMSRSFTDDEGSAIEWHHQSGFQDFGSASSRNVLSEVSAWGSGTPTVSVFTDHGSSDSNAAAVTLGTAPAVDEGKHRKSYRGALFSLKLSGSTPATVHRVRMFGDLR